jgi:hypothetical protein
VNRGRFGRSKQVGVQGVLKSGGKNVLPTDKLCPNRKYYLKSSVPEKS